MKEAACQCGHFVFGLVDGFDQDECAGNAITQLSTRLPCSRLAPRAIRKLRQPKGLSMTRIAIVIAAGLTFTATLPAAPVQAQRVFVSATGSDGNPCTFVSPCRGFQHAHDVAPANGEIDVLDPAGYGALTITKAISIQGHGFSGISVASGGTGITINASSSTDAINLSGLLINGGGIGSSGVVFNSGKSLTVENCIIRKMVFDGLDFLSTATVTQTLTVSNSYMSDNAGRGILIATASSGAVTASIDRTAFYSNAFGLFVSGDNGGGLLTVAATDSVATSNSVVGFIIESAPSRSVSNLSLTRSQAVGNGIGVEAEATNATLWLAESTLTGNATGFDIVGGGVIMSYGDNDLAAANGAPVGSLTPVSRQ
jgi:hypothetical protein